jgi:hypothetical protein
VHTRHRSPCGDWRLATEAPPPCSDGAGRCELGDIRQFAQMSAAYRASGGLVRGDDLVHAMAAHRNGDYLWLARLIVSHEVLSFDWNDSHWVPMFQFQTPELSMRPELHQLIKDLYVELDGWSLAVWFAAPNPALNGRAPVDQLACDLAGVQRAAHADGCDRCGNCDFGAMLRS